MRNRWLIIGCFLFFLVTRLYVWVAKPKEFSQITSVYMPYAHLWDSGIRPYLDQWYEYPPATIPLFYLPHLIDKVTMNFIWHINYGYAYRGLILGIDIGLFLLIWRSLVKFKARQEVIAGALIYYALATTKAHDFIYDSMDLVFVATVVFGIMAPAFFKKTGQFFGWLGYFAAVGFKLINAPLGLIYAVLERRNWRKLTFNIVLAGLIVWLMPLVLYRSSLSVMLVYHSKRGLQVESTPAQIAGVINRFTETEKYEVLYQSVNTTGPISTDLTRWFNWLLVIFVLIFIGWGAKIAWQTAERKQVEVKLALTLGYFFGFMLFGKVLSTPYLLWQMPLLAIFPFTSLKDQLKMTLPSMIMVILSMTSIPNLPLGILNLHLIIGLIRSGLLAFLLWQSVKLILKLNYGFTKTKEKAGVLVTTG